MKNEVNDFCRLRTRSEETLVHLHLFKKLFEDVKCKHWLDRLRIAGSSKNLPGNFRRNDKTIQRNMIRAIKFLVQ